MKLTCLLFTVVVLLLGGSFAQAPPQKRKIKKFGSSVKRLKWDPNKNATVETPDPDQPDKNPGLDVIRIDTDLVTCELLVRDSSGNIVTGLREQDFELTEDGAPQKVEHFLLGDNTRMPRTIVLIIDYSNSQIPYLYNSIAAAKIMVDKLSPNDLMAIVTDDIELLVDFTNDKKKLKSQLDSLFERTRLTSQISGIGPSQGRSMQYSALIATINEAFDNSDVRPIVVFQTDGDEVLFMRNSVVSLSIPDKVLPLLKKETLKDLERKQKTIQENLREFSLDDIYRMVEKSRATVYTVIPGTKLVGFTLNLQMEKNIQ